VGLGDLRQQLKSIQLKIPETGNGTPDILNEARWNLEWMLKMQDDDGGVWHKQTSEHFSGIYRARRRQAAERGNWNRICAVQEHMRHCRLGRCGAIAARVFKPYDAKFAARALWMPLGAPGPGRKSIPMSLSGIRPA
jgi:endoglucanase